MWWEKSFCKKLYITEYVNKYSSIDEITIEIDNLENILYNIDRLESIISALSIIKKEDIGTIKQLTIANSKVINLQNQLKLEMSHDKRTQINKQIQVSV